MLLADPQLPDPQVGQGFRVVFKVFILGLGPWGTVEGSDCATLYVLANASRSGSLVLEDKFVPSPKSYTD